MPPLESRDLIVAVDMAGCPNRCRHCWLGSPPNRRLPLETLARVAEAVRGWARPGESAPFFRRLTVASWYREPDYAPNYRELYRLERELSDEPARYELLSIWRLARDEGYACWAREIGTEACQSTFFGLERTTDRFVRRAGAFRDNLLATERLLAVGIRPRWQLILTEAILPELEGLGALSRSLNLEARVAALGGDFHLFLNSPSPDGEAFHLEPLRPGPEALARVPAYLAAKTLAHFGREDLADCLGRPEADWLPELLVCATPPSLAPPRLALLVNAELDVFPSISELTPWWRLGNLEADGVGAILAAHERDLPAGYRANYHLPTGELAARYGRPEGRQLYTRDDLLLRWLHLWGLDETRRDTRR